ncbi:MAG TPA: FAD-dependent thymidylate synthase [Thermotogota bacterium]|nr:FAD-dependent thymidylate synthase [Thermotogota bacterium]
MRFEILDHGYLELVDKMGDDFRAVEAARVSFQQGLKEEKKDRALLFFLMEHGHLSPFEHIVFTFRVKAPLFVARQWFRHRIGSFNEMSGRYSEIQEEFYLPSEIRGRGGEAELHTMEKVSRECFHAYHALLDSGVAREMARMILPVNLYTQWFWTVNARSLMNFLCLRADRHAQWEIQQYALAVARVFQSVCPVTYDAFVSLEYSGDLLG